MIVNQLNDGSEDKKTRGTKMCVMKRKFKFKSYRNCLEANKIDNNKNYLEKK